MADNWPDHHGRVFPAFGGGYEGRCVCGWELLTITYTVARRELDKHLGVAPSRSSDTYHHDRGSVR